MSIKVSIDELLEQVGEWGFGYLLTTGDDARPRLIALVPTVTRRGTLRFATGAASASHNVAERPSVAIVFPPGPHSAGFSLVVDGEAEVADVAGEVFVDVVPTSAVMHRPAP